MAGEATFEADRYTGASSQELDYEADLVRRAKARSAGAWSEIYERYYPKIFRYMQARLPDRETAEDLSSTVFIEALKSIDSYKMKGRPLLAWLYTIARNVANYHYRSLLRKEGRWQGLPLLSRFLAAEQGEVRAESAAGEATDPAEMVEGWDLRDAISKLSSDQREVIALRFFVGLTTPETGRVLGKHERAVYSLQTRAIQALRKHLG